MSEFKEFVAQTDFSIGKNEEKSIDVREGSVIEFDGTKAIINGEEHNIPKKMRGAVSAGWVEEPQKARQQDFNPRSAEIEMSAPTPQGEESVARGDADIKDDERVVSEVNTHEELVNEAERTYNTDRQGQAHERVQQPGTSQSQQQQPQQSRQQQQTQQGQQPPGRHSGAVVEQTQSPKSSASVGTATGGTEQGQVVAGGFASPTKQSTELGEANRQSVDRMIQESRSAISRKNKASNPNNNQPQQQQQAPQQGGRQQQAGRQAPRQKQAQQPQARQQQAQAPRQGAQQQQAQRPPSQQQNQPSSEEVNQIHREGITFENEGISERAAEAAGSHEQAPQPQSNGQSQSVQIDDGEIEESIDKETKKGRYELIRVVCPDLPDWDFDEHWKRKLSSLRENEKYAENDKAIRAIYAAESEALKKHIRNEFPEAFV